MNECNDAFQNDADVSPVGVVDSLDESTTTDSLQPPKKAKNSQVMTKYQEERLKLKREEIENKAVYRQKIVNALDKLIDKL